MCVGIGALAGAGAELRCFAVVLPARRKPKVAFRDRQPVPGEDRLCREFGGLVIHFAKRHCGVSGLNFDEVVSELNRRLLHTIRSFDASRGAPMRALICLALRQRVYQSRADRNARATISLNTGDDDGFATRAAVDHRQPSDRLDRKELRQSVQAAVEQLDNPYQRKVIEGLFLKGRTPEELARKWGVTTSTIGFHKKRGLQRLREIMGDSNEHT